MNQFEFFNPTKIIYGTNCVSLKLSNLIPAGKRILLVYGGGSVKKNGSHAHVMEALKGREVLEFSGVPANPTYEILMDGVRLIKEKNIQFILALGGGSVIDGVKFLAAASLYQGEDPWDILSKRAEVQNALPFGCVLTLPATGSEMNAGSVITREQTGDKLFFMSEKVFPQFSLLDPQYTLSLDARQMGNGVVDAFVHVLEQYLTIPTNSPIQDGMAESILKCLIDQGGKLLKNPHDLGIRGNLMWAATMALNGLIGAGVTHDWSTHMIGHELTALFGLDHARTLAVVLPGNLRERRGKKTEKLLQYATQVWGLKSGADDEKIEQAITLTERFFEEMGVKTKLSAYSLERSVIPKVLENLKRHGMTRLGEDGSVGLEVVEKILLRQL